MDSKVRVGGVWASVAVIIAAIILAGGPGGGDPDPTPTPTPTATATPGPGLANLYVVAGAGSCTRAATPGDYASSASPDSRCDDFDTAYQAAAYGDTVLVRSGDYGDVAITEGSKEDDDEQPVSFSIYPGDSAPTVTDFTVRGSNVLADGFDVELNDNDDAGGEPTIIGAHDITLTNFTGRRFYIQGGDNDPVGGSEATPQTYNITISHSDFGPLITCGGGSHIKTFNDGGDSADVDEQPHHVLLDDISLHDYSVPADCPTAHLDCLHTFFAYNLTIRNSEFYRCGLGVGAISDDRGYGILLDSRQEPDENDLIENNKFWGSTINGFALRGGDGEEYDNVTVRYNSGDSITPQVTNTLNNVVWEANAATDIGACREGLTYSYNIATTGGCGVTDVEAAPGFTDLAAGDLHLTSDANARGAGDPSDCPATDFDGLTRPNPLGTICDAGAFERA